MDLEGNLYVADSRNARVQKFNGSGKFLSQWGSAGSGEGQFDLPFGIMVDQEENVYVADWNIARIQKFSTRP